MQSNLGYPFFGTLVYSLKSGLVVGSKALISGIFGSGTFAKITATVVETVVVLVVYYLAFYCSDYFPMHSYMTGASRKINAWGFPHGVIHLGFRCPMRMPVELGKPFVIFAINDSIKIVSERDVAVGCVERLRNGMSCKRLSGHVLTSNENLVATAILA